MKTGVLILAAAAVLWTSAAVADPTDVPANVFLTTQGEGQYLAKDLLLGAKVQDADGQIIGDIEDLILNGDNQVEGVVMGTGGFIGFGEKRIGVSLSALQITNADGKVTVKLPQATKEVLNTLEPFKRSEPPKSLLDRAIEKAKELSDKSAVTAKDAYDKAKEEAAPALEKAKEAAQDAYEKAKEEAGPAFEKAKEAAQDAFDKAKEAVEGAGGETATPEPEASAPETTAPAEPATQEPASAQP